MRINQQVYRFLNSEHLVPAVFIILSFFAWQFSGLSGTFVLNQVITRFIRDGILVLSLIIPVVAGMGLNFAITVGAMAVQTALLIVIGYQVEGIPGIVLVIIMGVFLSALLGYLIGRILNRVKGKEMITTIIIGFLFNNIIVDEYRFLEAPKKQQSSTDDYDQWANAGTNNVTDDEIPF